MKWFRFFRTVGLVIVLLAVFVAVLWYGKQLDGLTLSSVAARVFFISILALSLGVIIPAVKRRWGRKPIDQRLVGQKLGFFYYVFWGVLFFSYVTFMAVQSRAIELRRERDLSAPLTEFYDLYQAMQSVSLTLIFACLFLMIRFSRSIQDENSRASEDQ